MEQKRKYESHVTFHKAWNKELCDKTFECVVRILQFTCVSGTQQIRKDQRSTVRWYIFHFFLLSSAHHHHHINKPYSLERFWSKRKYFQVNQIEYVISPYPAMNLILYANLCLISDPNYSRKYMPCHFWISSNFFYRNFLIKNKRKILYFFHLFYVSGCVYVSKENDRISVTVLSVSVTIFNSWTFFSPFILFGHLYFWVAATKRTAERNIRKFYYSRLNFSIE